MAAVTIQLARAEDWARYRDIRLAGLAESPDAFGSTLEREQAFDEQTWRARAGSGACFLAVAADGAVLGTASGYADPDGPATERLLVAMWVAPSARGQGVAGELIAAVAAWARADGASALRLNVARHNHAAQRAYRRAGFEKTGQAAPLPRDPGVVEEVMVRPL
jgi:RimJ/RimL family protein N-acetyltransferase